MTIFEFLSIAVSIVLALALGKLITATPHIFKRETRHLVHGGFFLVTNLAVLAMWWHVWTLSEKETWNFLEFLVMMGSPIALYSAAQILVSHEPSEVRSWEEYFAGAYHWFFGALLASTIFAMVRAVWVLKADASVVLGLVGLCVVFVVGILSKKLAIQVCVLLLWALFQIFAVAERFTAV